MNILKAKVLGPLKLEVTTEHNIYTIDLKKSKDHEYDVLHNYDYFKNNMKYDKWMVYWDDETDISIDELESNSVEIKDRTNV